MSERFRIRKYAYDQKNLLFLSPYCVINYDGGCLCIWQSVFDLTLKLHCKRTFSEELIKRLSKGITRDGLREVLSSALSSGEADDLIGECMRAGIIE